MIIEIDDELASEALELSGLQKMEDVIKLGLLLFVRLRLKKQRIIRRYRGQLNTRPNYLATQEERIRAVR